MSPLAPTSPNPLFQILARQAISNDANSIKATFSSWDSCMAKAYCKWPVIAVIIGVSLIVLSLLICLARVCCCGMECCCLCCSCCNACCPSPRGRNKGGNYQQAPSGPQYTPQQPYGYTAPMNYPPNNGYGPPQFATYENASKGPGGAGREDALPAMPSWANSTSRHVEDTSYRGAGAEAGQDGIALGAVSPNGKRVRDDEPLYEDPEDQLQPMLNGRNLSAQGQSSYAQSEYSEAGNMHTPSQAGSEFQEQQHPYAAHNQQQQSYSDFPITEPRSPGSMYNTQYPPAYRSQAPSIAPTYQQADAYQHQQSYTSPSSTRLGSNSVAPSTRYEPSTAVPSILAPGGGAARSPQYAQQRNEQYYELGGGQGVSR